MIIDNVLFIIHRCSPFVFASPSPCSLFSAVHCISNSLFISS
jgi:hypothetical protein